jgi:hypothetical protein
VAVRARTCCGESGFQLYCMFPLKAKSDDAWSASARSRWQAGFRLGSAQRRCSPPSRGGVVSAKRDCTSWKPLRSLSILVLWSSRVGDLCVSVRRGAEGLFGYVSVYRRKGRQWQRGVGAIGWCARAGLGLWRVSVGLRVVRDAQSPRAGAKPRHFASAVVWPRLQLEQLSDGERGIGELSASYWPKRCRRRSAAARLRRFLRARLQRRKHHGGGDVEEMLREEETR